jgi:hypothetical protein
MSAMLLTAVVAIRLVHAGRIPEGILERAEKAAAAIFARAGVEARWVDCRYEDCATGWSPTVQFLEQRAGAPGYATLAGGQDGYAVVRYPVVQHTAEGVEADAAPLLGATIAHEVGHLLLGRAHGSRGVMSAHFRPADIQEAARGQLGFTPEEARRLRTALERRQTAAAR